VTVAGTWSIFFVVDRKAVAIPEFKKWGPLRGQGKCRGSNINVYLEQWRT